MKSKRKETNRNYYLMNMIVFIGFSFEFFIRSDDFLGVLTLFNGVVNLLAYQQAPRKIAPVTVILNLFNALISCTIAYNYASINYVILLYIWVIVSLIYLFTTFFQIGNLIQNKRSKRKHRKRQH